jgi:hypothetical protein
LERDVKKTELIGRSPLRRQRLALDYRTNEEEDPTDLYLFLSAKDGYNWAVYTSTINLTLKKRERERKRAQHIIKVVSEKALSSFAASMHNKQVRVSGLHLYIHYLNIHYVTSFINYLRMCKTISVESSVFGQV